MTGWTWLPQDPHRWACSAVESARPFVHRFPEECWATAVVGLLGWLLTDEADDGRA
jgi:hypothetical protein